MMAIPRPQPRGDKKASWPRLEEENARVNIYAYLWFADISKTVLQERLSKATAEAEEDSLNSGQGASIEGVAICLKI
jgi:hypothetical protein